jgi:ABC-type polysaccharide/polyol phosphate export permease
MYLTNLVINIVQIAIILGISLIFLEDASSRIPQVALILLLVASIFTFIGMVIGYIFNTEETGVLASISLGSLFLLFSGMILPLESVSAFIRGIASFNPFVLAERLVREIFLFGSPLDSLFRELGILGVYALVLFIAIIFIESFLHQHYVRRFLKHHHRAHRQKDKRNRNDA